MFRGACVWGRQLPVGWTEGELAAVYIPEGIAALAPELEGHEPHPKWPLEADRSNPRMVLIEQNRFTYRAFVAPMFCNDKEPVDWLQLMTSIKGPLYKNGDVIGFWTWEDEAFRPSTPEEHGRYIWEFRKK